MARSCPLVCLLLSSAAWPMYANRPSSNSLPRSFHLDAAEATALMEEGTNMSSNGTYSVTAVKKASIGCVDYCITCPSEEGGEAISWKVRRAQSGLKKFAMGTFSVAALAGIAATGFVSIPVAGALASVASTVGIGAGVTVAAGTMGGGLLVKDMLTETRECPLIHFYEINNDNNNPLKKSVAHEEDYSVDDLNLLELMGQLDEDTPEGSSLGKDYPRNNLGKADRLHAIMACNMLPLPVKKWADIAIQDERLTEMARKHGSIETAVLAECGKWLCADSPEDIYQLGSLGVTRCGGRSGFNSKMMFHGMRRRRGRNSRR